MISTKDISSFIIFIVFYYFFIAIARFLLPFGDEPDFGYRVYSILSVDKTILNPFGYFISFFESFDWYEGSENVYMKLFRVNWTYGLIFSTIFLASMLAFIHFKFQPLSIRIEAFFSIKLLFLSLFFPSVWFHLGFLAEEQFTLLVSLLAIIFRKSLISLLIIGLFISNIDLGNSIVFFSFLIFYFFFNFIIKYFGYIASFVFVLVFFVLALVVKMELLKILFYFPVIGDKASGIYNDYTNVYNINNKYPIILRPIITFMSLVIMLPNSQTFFLLPYVFVLTSFFLTFKRFIRNFKILMKDSAFLRDLPFFLSTLSTVLCFPIILPGFSNGKYYVFVIPFVILFFSYLVSVKKIIYFLLFLNFLVFFQLFLMSFYYGI